MYVSYKSIRAGVFHLPLSLSSLRDRNDPLNAHLVEYAESLLPYSTGIEIECAHKEEYYCGIEERSQKIRDYGDNPGPINLTRLDGVFETVPDIMSVSCDKFEKRFRIPPGIKGMVCLFRICELLKETCTLNPGSGIHYHVDFTDCYSSIEDNTDLFTDNNNDWVMNAIRHWKYKGNYNSLHFSTAKTAVRLHPFYQTIEFRIGEMTFDYSLMMKRIVNCHNITRALKEKSKSQCLPNNKLISLSRRKSHKISASIARNNKTVAKFNARRAEIMRAHARRERNLRELGNPMLRQYSA